MKQWVIGYGIVLIGTVVLTTLFNLSWAACAVIGVVGCVLVSVWLQIGNKKKEAIERYDELTVYMELLLCSFKRVGHLKLALLDCQSVFPSDSRMGKAIAGAIHVLESGECGGRETIAEASLKQISNIYNCRRMELVHRFLCRADYTGNDVAEALDILLADFEMWKRRFVLYQKKKQSIGRECILSVVLALLLCLVSRVLIPGDFLPIIEKSMIYQVSTVVVICSLLGVYTFVLSCVGRLEWERKVEKKLMKEVEQEFPYWLLAVTVYLKNDSLYHALQHSREEVSGRFQSELDCLIDAVYQKPAALEPFTNFFQGLPLAELQTGMKLLYSVNTNGYQDASKQIQFLVEQSHVVMNQTESQYFRMKLAGFRMLRQIPMMLAGGKVVVDVLTFFMIMGSQMPFLNGG